MFLQSLNKLRLCSAYARRLLLSPRAITRYRRRLAQMGVPKWYLYIGWERYTELVFRVCWQWHMGLKHTCVAVYAENLHSLERTECRIVRWMCGVSLSDRRLGEDLYDSLLDIQKVADVVRHGKSRWFGHFEHEGKSEWVLACRNMKVAGVKCEGGFKRTWEECVRMNMEMLGLEPKWVIFRDVRRDLIYGELYMSSDLSSAWKQIDVLMIVTTSSTRRR